MEVIKKTIPERKTEHFLVSYNVKIVDGFCVYAKSPTKSVTFIQKNT